MFHDQTEGLTFVLKIPSFIRQVTGNSSKYDEVFQMLGVLFTLCMQHQISLREIYAWKITRQFSKIFSSNSEDK